MSVKPLQLPLLLDDLVCLDLVILLEVLEILEANTTFGTLAHLRNVLLDMLERVDFAYVDVSISASHGISLEGGYTGESYHHK